MRSDNIKRVITDLSTKYGAPMGRSNKYPQNYILLDLPSYFIVIDRKVQRVYDKRVPMIDGAYDIGGAYWGIGAELRVKFSKDLSYVEFYRKQTNNLNF